MYRCKNNSAVVIVGDMFSVHKQHLRGQIDIHRGDDMIWTTLDLRADINVGDMFGVQLPGIAAMWESTVVSRTINSIRTSDPFPGNDLIGYSGSLAFRRQANSGRPLGEAVVVKSRQEDYMATLTDNELLLRVDTAPVAAIGEDLDTDDDSDDIVLDEEGGEEDIETERNATSELISARRRANIVQAEVLCDEVRHQHRKVVRIEGTVSLVVEKVEPDAISLSNMYCADGFEAVKLYRSALPRPTVVPPRFPLGDHATTELDGTVSVGNGSFIAVTTRNVCPVVLSGDRVQIADQVCVVEYCKPAMLVMKCPTRNGAWQSRYTGVNFRIFRLPRVPNAQNRSRSQNATNETRGAIGGRETPFFQQLRDLVNEKLKCTSLNCIRRIQALECAVHEQIDLSGQDPDNGGGGPTIAGLPTLRKNLDCLELRDLVDAAGDVREPTSPAHLKPRKVVKVETEKWGFFT